MSDLTLNDEERIKDGVARGIAKGRRDAEFEEKWKRNEALKQQRWNRLPASVQKKKSITYKIVLIFYSLVLIGLNVWFLFTTQKTAADASQGALISLVICTIALVLGTFGGFSLCVKLHFDGLVDHFNKFEEFLFKFYSIPFWLIIGFISIISIIFNWMHYWSFGYDQIWFNVSYWSTIVVIALYATQIIQYIVRLIREATIKVKK